MICWSQGGQLSHVDFEGVLPQLAVMEDHSRHLWSSPSSGAVSDQPDAGAARHTEGHNATDGGISLRGTLPTDRHGMVEFATIVPGWYPGRTEHVHLKVKPCQCLMSVLYRPLACFEQCSQVCSASLTCLACLDSSSLPSAGAVA